MSDPLVLVDFEFAFAGLDDATNLRLTVQDGRDTVTRDEARGLLSLELRPDPHTLDRVDLILGTLRYQRATQRTIPAPAPGDPDWTPPGT